MQEAHEQEQRREKSGAKPKSEKPDDRPRRDCGPQYEDKPETKSPRQEQRRRPKKRKSYRRHAEQTDWKMEQR